MAGYIIILICAVLVWTIVFRQSHFELLSAGSTVMLGFIVSTAFALIGTSTWNQVILSSVAIEIIIVGFISVLLACVFIKVFLVKISGNKHRISRSSRCCATPAWKYGVLASLVVLAIVFRVVETVEIGRKLGMSSFSYPEISAAVRDATAVFKSAEAMKFGTGFSVIERQMEKVVLAIGYVAAFLLARSLANGERKGLLFSGLIFVESCAFCLISGGRGTIMYYVIALIVMYSIMAYNTTSDPRRLTRRLLAVGIIVAAACAIGMFFAGAAVGRKTGANIVDYITFYFGGSIPSLELLTNHVPPTTLQGVNTFYNIFSPLYKFGLIENYPNYSITWVSLGGFSSNIFTCFARYYIDFGLVGVLLLGFAATLVMQMVYYHARRTAQRVWILLAGYLGAYAFDCAREEFIFSRLLSITHILVLVMAVLILVFMTTSIRECLESIKSRLTPKEK